MNSGRKGGEGELGNEKIYKSPSRPMCIVSPCLSWFSISYFNCLLVLIKEKTFKIIAWQLCAIQVHRLLGGVKQ